MNSLQQRAAEALAGVYGIERELGRGGMATVFLAHDARHARKVAVKVLHPDLAHAIGPDRFLREVRIAANLSHPHIVPLFDSGQADGLLYYVMPFVEGESLGERIRQRGVPPLGEAVRILRAVTDALGFAHSRGVVHRDIKPDNVMLSAGHALVADFGVAKAIGNAQGDGLTVVGMAIGTPAYMAPEQVAGDPDVDHRADLYAVGAMAYELLAGCAPFDRPTAQEVLAAHVSQAPQPLSQHGQGVPTQLEAAVMRCLAKRPTERWQNAAELCAQFDEVLGTFTPTPAASLHADTASTAVLASPVAPNTAATTSARRAIVVLPFANQSADPDNEYFSDGLTEEVIADLAQIAALSVISRTSAMQLKGTDRSIREIGRELDVRYVLEGSVRRAGNSLRITVQLIDAEGDAQLWAEKYSGTMDDVFDLQERVSRQIVAALDVKLSPAEDRRLAERPIRDARAFELYLQARQEFRRMRGPQLALPLVERAIEIEGETPPLKALLGFTHVLEMRSGMNRDARPLDRAEAIARELAAAAPEAPYAHALQGYVEYERGRLARAVRCFRTALRYDAADDDILIFSALAYIAAGHNERAADVIERLVAADPLSPSAWMLRGCSQWFIGHFARGVAHLHHGLELDPQNFILRWCTGYTHAALGQLEEAGQHAAWMHAAAPDVAYTLQLRSLLAALSGNPAEAAAMLVDFDPAPLDGHLSFHLAESYILAGQRERGLDLFETSIDKGFYPARFFSEYCPFLESLRGTERFDTLVQRAQARVDAFGSEVQ